MYKLSDNIELHQYKQSHNVFKIVSILGLLS